MHLQLLPTDSRNDTKQPQGTHYHQKGNPSSEAIDPEVPTKCNGFGATRELVTWEVSLYRSALQPSNGMKCDDVREHQTVQSTTPLLPLQTLLWAVYLDRRASCELPLKFGLAWDRPMVRRTVFAEVFESRRRRMGRRDARYNGGFIPHLTGAAVGPPPPVSGPLLAPLPENPSPRHEVSRISALFSVALSRMSKVDSGIKPHISSEPKIPASLERCTSSPSQIELEVDRDHMPTNVSLDPEKQTPKEAALQIRQSFDSTLSRSSSSSRPKAAPPPTEPHPKRRGRPRKKPLSNQPVPRGPSAVGRRLGPDTAAKAITDNRISMTRPGTSSLVGLSQQARGEISRDHVHYIQTPPGSETLASMFDGDLSELEEDRPPLLGDVPDSALGGLPETLGNIQLNTKWRTLAPVKVSQRHRKRLAAALQGHRKGTREAVNNMHITTARNAVLARRKKGEQGGISGYVSSPNGNARPHEDQNIVNAEIRRVVESLALIRSPPEKEQK
jgi:hypothetical protein